MIESRLDPLLDGIGGGAGDRDLTVADIAAEFRYLATEGRARSVSAVLRILREQAVGRSKRAALPAFAAATTLMAAAVIGFYSRSNDPIVRARFVPGILGTLLIIAPLAFVAYTERHRAARDRAQLAELRRLALETLGLIVGRAEFHPRALDKDERKAFASLRSTGPEGWLQVAKALAGETA